MILKYDTISMLLKFLFNFMSLARQRFFDKQVHMQVWKDSMAGQNEERTIQILTSLGYVLGKDFVRQHPIGERFVIDIAFVNEQVAIEVDGKSHLEKKQRGYDKKRDKYLRVNDWVAIRIDERDMFGFKGSFYKSLIRDIVEERRAQWEVGVLVEIEIPNYDERDY